MTYADQPLWQPSPEAVAEANMTAFMTRAAAQWDTEFADYQAFRRWSVTENEKFWQTLWDFGGVIASSRGDLVVADKTKLPGARWFPEARLNFAENLLRRRDDSIAMVFRGEDQVRRTLTFNELYDQVSRLAQALAAAGINPGDREHTVERITKVVAGQTPQVVEILTALYGAVTAGGVHVAKDIKTAEAAKVIENAQRDINIAFINEVSMIFDRLGISIHDVLETSATKWNFLDFKPGLVGGHCIGVDPFYLAHCGLEFGHNPEIILAGRRINDGMGAYVAGRILDALATAGSGKPSRVLVLGLTFKENVPDLRNSKVIDVIRGLAATGLTVDVHDPIADPAMARQLYGVDLVPGLDGLEAYDGVIGAVSHAVYRALDGADLAGLVKSGGLVADIKGMWRDVTLPDGLHHWQL